MNPTMLQSFLSVALPICITFVVVIWAAQSGTGRAFDGVNKRLDDIIARLTRIEAKLEDHQDRIVRLEERTPIVRRG